QLHGKPNLRQVRKRAARPRELLPKLRNRRRRRGAAQAGDRCKSRLQNHRPRRRRHRPREKRDFEADGATIAARAPGGVEESDYLGSGDELTCTADDETSYLVRVLAIDDDEQTVTMLVMIDE